MSLNESTADRALLATKHLDSSKHTGVVSLFNQHFVKEGIVTNNLGRMLMKAKDLRQDGDYKDFVETTMEEAHEQYRECHIKPDLLLIYRVYRDEYSLLILDLTTIYLNKNSLINRNPLFPSPTSQ
jgi:mRNA-degrading endonuclease YafQ of YafQ-DinJ toxin-antitoxin module